MNTEPNILKDEGYKFMGAAFEVYNEIGYGLLEEIYQEALEIELDMRGIPFIPKQELTTHYKKPPSPQTLYPRPFRIQPNRRRAQSRYRNYPRTRSPIVQLLKNFPNASRLFSQFRPPKYFGVETHHHSPQKD